ncbi:MAG TPA: LysM peptidoglycan-binding domain-containing protein, partial [Mycobacteriales bacterium]|nr:LysM peptidoglycan-binding domain-containing protein [Mycobacteriales bacterium]
MNPSGRYRLARAIVAGLILLALLAGPPAVLLALGATPLPHRTPDLARLRTMLVRPDDGTVLLAAAALLCWAAWSAFAAAASAEIAAAARGRAARRLPGLAGPQRLAATLITAIAASLAIPAAGSAAPPTAVPAPVLEHAELMPATSAVAGSPLLQPAVYRVRRHDTPWRIAETQLGDGRRWVELWRLNAHRHQPNGQAWTDPDLIQQGWTLQLPGRPPRPANGSIVVAAGDTLTALASRHLGQPSRWPDLFDANRGARQPD